MVNNIFGKLLAIICFSVIASTANALPSLQLGGSGGGWTYDYDSDKETWVTSKSSFIVNAFANAKSAEGGNGDYAWGDAATEKIAYLVFAGVPNVNDGDVFDISVKNNGISLSLITSGYGTPPIEDPNSLSPHGIYASYFEIYEFKFDGEIKTILDTQPDKTGEGKGYEESFDIFVTKLNPAITGIHMDLFTISGTGKLVLGGEGDNKLVNAYAPFSHDAEYISPAPEPATTLLLGIGVASLARIIRGKKRK